MAPNQTPLADLTDFLAAAIKKIESSQTQLEEKIGRRLRQVDQDQADLANGICTLTEQHRSLQAENESLKEDVYSTCQQDANPSNNTVRTCITGRTNFKVQPVSLMTTWTDLMPFHGRTISDF